MKNYLIIDLTGSGCDQGCLTGLPALPMLRPLSDGWTAAARALAVRGEESPGSTGSGCRVTPGGGDPRESATENRPPAPAADRRQG